AVDPTDSNVVYASALHHFYKSTDGGATWAISDNGLALGTQINGIIQINPDDTSILYVSTKYGFGTSYVSTDAGADWFPLTTGLATYVAAHATESMGRSTQSTTASSADEITLGAVMIDPNNHKRIYAGGSDGNIYAYDNLHPPVASSTGGSGGSGGGTGGAAD